MYLSRLVTVSLLGSTVRLGQVLNCYLGGWETMHPQMSMYYIGNSRQSFAVVGIVSEGSRRRIIDWSDQVSNVLVVARLGRLLYWVTVIGSGSGDTGDIEDEQDSQEGNERTNAL